MREIAMLARATFSLCLLALAAHPDDITLEEVLSRPEGRMPRRFRFFPDGKRIAYLKAREEQGHLSDLWEYDISQGRRSLLVRAPGRQALSAAEVAAKERRRDKGRGIGEYRINPVDGSILLLLSGDLHLFRNGKLTRLASTRSHERNPRWAPDGKAIAYVRRNNLYVRRGEVEQRLTWEGIGKTRCGLAEFIAMEELGRHEGFWWSPDSRSIAYVCTGSRRVPVFRIADPGKPRGGVIEQEYPRAGDPNVSWSLRVVPATGGRPVLMQVKGEYLVRVDWMPDGRLVVQTSNRMQMQLDLWECDPRTGRAVRLLSESDHSWVAFHDNLRFLEDGRFLWTSERSGRRHIYLRGKDSPIALTKGPWDVASVLGVEEKNGFVHFVAARESPHERHLYRVRLDGTEVVRLTAERGWHSIRRSRNGAWFIDTYSAIGIPPRIVLRDATGAIKAELANSKRLPAWRAPELLKIPAADGQQLEAMLYRSAMPGKRPAIVYCYGGPGSHLVRNRWGGVFHLWHTRMAQRGYHVLLLDGRGTGGYGVDWRRCVAGQLCDWEVKDQAAGAAWLGQQEFADPARIGIWGWSYGGTLTLMALLKAPGRFAAGVAVAPVTDWRDYDTAYTERYLGLPGDNPEAYAKSSPVTYAAGLKRPVLLVHGMLDDNVHFRNAVNFVEQAGPARKWIETDFYAKGRHGISDPASRLALFRRMERFWDARLVPGK